MVNIKQEITKQIIMFKDAQGAPVANLLCTWMEVFLVARQSGVGIVLPVIESPVGGCATGGGWGCDRADAGNLPFPVALAML